MPALLRPASPDRWQNYSNLTDKNGLNSWHGMRIEAFGKLLRTVPPRPQLVVGNILARGRRTLDFGPRHPSRSNRRAAGGSWDESALGLPRRTQRSVTSANKRSTRFSQLPTADPVSPASLGRRFAVQPSRSPGTPPSVGLC